MKENSTPVFYRIYLIFLEAARRFRARKATVIHQLELSVTQLTNANKELINDVQQLEIENHKWKFKEGALLRMNEELKRRLQGLRKNDI